MSLPIDIYTRILSALDIISQGNAVTMACDKAGVSYASLRKYCAENTELQELFNDAEQRGFDAMADTLVSFDKLQDKSSTDSKDMKLMSDNIKWFLSRKRPQQYGERVVIENHFTADKAITEALARGRQRAVEARVLDNVAYEVVSDVIDVLVDDTDVSEFV